MGIWGDVGIVLRHAQLTTSDLHIQLVRYQSISSETTPLVTADISISGKLGPQSSALAQDVILSCTIHAHDSVKGKSGAPLVTLEVPLASVMAVNQRQALQDSPEARHFSLPLTIPRAQLWGPWSPVLFHATITLQSAVDGTVIDVETDRFGLRTLKIDGPYFVLNGARHFMLGMGDDHPTSK